MKIQSKRGFTLVELLVVVLIIGVLASVALPLYQNAVDKSRWARLVSPARSIANAEEAVMMSNGSYTAEKDDLVVSLPTDSDLSYTLYTTENGDDANFVRVESSKLDNIRLARYYKVNEGSSENVYCEAKSDNERANKLCGKLLKGAAESTTADGYKAYLIEGTNACLSSGMPYDGATGVCGWIDDMGQTIGNGGTCIARTVSPSAQMGVAPGPCSGSIVQAGGECRSENNEVGDTIGCGNSQIYGVCVAEDGSAGCRSVHVYQGGVCIAEGNVSMGCMSAQIDAGGICNGSASGSCRGATISGTCNGDGERSCSGEAWIYMGSMVMSDFPMVVKSGGICNGNAEGACSGFRLDNDAPLYDRAIFESGSVCNGNANGSCVGQFQAGATCYANVAGACAGDYSQGGCCVGTHCPSGTQCS